MLKKRPTRSANVSIITLFVLCFTLWYAVRIYSSINNWQVLLEFGTGPAYILVTGLLWFSAGLCLLGLLWKRHPFTIRAGLVLAGLYTVWYWVDRLYIQVSPAPNVVFSAILSTVLLIIYSFILATSAS